MAAKWIQGAVKKPGQLHRDLGVAAGKKIPASTLQAAAKKPGKVGQRARLALTLRRLGGRSSRNKGAVKLLRE
jgi:hypothetical protein